MIGMEEQNGKMNEGRIAPILDYEGDHLLEKAEAYLKEHGTPGKDADKFGFKYESFDEFTETPLDFEEYTASLLEDLLTVYSVAGVYNRFSPNYHAAVSVIEKIVRRLGSCCVTKAVLEKEGFKFPRLDDLSVCGLYCTQLRRRSSGASS